MSNVKLLDFWAAWCGPCKIMHPIIEEIEKEFAGKVEVVKVDVDDAQNQQLVQDYQVGAMPTYIIEKDGQVVEQFIGAQPKSVLVKALDHTINGH